MGLKSTCVFCVRGNWLLRLTGCIERVVSFLSLCWLRLNLAGKAFKEEWIYGKDDNQIPPRSRREEGTNRGFGASDRNRTNSFLDSSLRVRDASNVGRQSDASALLTPLGAMESFQGSSPFAGFRTESLQRIRSEVAGTLLSEFSRRSDIYAPHRLPTVGNHQTFGEWIFYRNGTVKLGDKIFVYGVPIHGYHFGANLVAKHRIDQPNLLTVVAPHSGPYFFEYVPSSRRWFQLLVIEDPLLYSHRDRFGIEVAVILFYLRRWANVLWILGILGAYVLLAAAFGAAFD